MEAVPGAYQLYGDPDSPAVASPQFRQASSGCTRLRARSRPRAHELLPAAVNSTIVGIVRFSAGLDSCPQAPALGYLGEPSPKHFEAAQLAASLLKAENSRAGAIAVDAKDIVNAVVHRTKLHDEKIQIGRLYSVNRAFPSLRPLRRFR